MATTYGQTSPTIKEVFCFVCLSQCDLQDLASPCRFLSTVRKPSARRGAWLGFLTFGPTRGKLLNFKAFLWIKKIRKLLLLTFCLSPVEDTEVYLLTTLLNMYSTHVLCKSISTSCRIRSMCVNKSTRECSRQAAQKLSMPYFSVRYTQKLTSLVLLSTAVLHDWESLCCCFG